MTKSQIKIQNLTLKIQQLAKGLNKFTISDIQQIFPDESKNIPSILKDLETKAIIKKTSLSEYLYIKMSSSFQIEKENISNIDIENAEWLSMEEVSALTGEKLETVRRKCKRQTYECTFVKSGRFKLYKIKKSSIKIKPMLPFHEVEFKKQKYNLEPYKDVKFKTINEQKIFEEAKDWQKIYIAKSLIVFKLAGRLKGNALNEFLKELGKKHPEYKISYTTFTRRKKLYLKGGIQKLLPRYGEALKNKSVIPQDMYDDFKKIYFESNKLSLEKSVKELENLGYEKATIPSSKSFYRLLHKEYSTEYIESMRNRKDIIANIELNYPIKKQVEKHKILLPIYTKYIDAADAYVNKYKNNKTNTIVSRIGYIKNHLNPFFKSYKFEDFTQDIIIEFRNKKQAEGFAPASIKRFLSCLCAIMIEYNIPKSHLNFSEQSIIPVNSEYLDNNEIEYIIKNDDIPKLFIITLGLSLGELGALEYSDIDFKNKTITIDKFLYNNKIQKHRKQYKIRKLKLPKILETRLNPKGKGLICPHAIINNYTTLLNTYVKLLLDKNITINIINKMLGYQCLNDFENKFKNLLPQKLDSNFEIL